MFSYTIKRVIVLLVNLQQRYYCEFYNFYNLNSLICSDKVSDTVYMHSASDWYNSAMSQQAEKIQRVDSCSWPLGVDTKLDDILFLSRKQLIVRVAPFTKKEVLQYPRYNLVFLTHCNYLVEWYSFGENRNCCSTQQIILERNLDCST